MSGGVGGGGVRKGESDECHLFPGQVEILV